LPCIPQRVCQRKEKFEKKDQQLEKKNSSKKKSKATEKKVGKKSKCDELEPKGSKGLKVAPATLKETDSPCHTRRAPFAKRLKVKEIPQREF